MRQQVATKCIWYSLFVLSMLAVVHPLPALAQSPICSKFVATNGANSGTGSSAAPWSLAHALAGAGGQVTAGQTVCIKGGTYTPAVTTISLSGSASAPIIFRNTPGERVIIDALGKGGNFITITGSNLWLWGLEITDSSVAPPFNTGVAITGGSGVKLINCVTHDMGGAGMGAWAENTGFELYGTASYFNGRNISARGYGIYTQNATGAKLYEDNFFFWNFGGYNIHAYGQAGALNNMTYRANVSMDGIMMIGGTESKAQNLVWESNFNYKSGLDEAGSIVYIGYSAGVSNAIIKDNLFPSGNVWWAYANQVQTMTGNLFRGNLYYHNNTPGGVTPAQTTIPAQFPQNTYLFDQGSGLPALHGNRIFVRKNKYEPGRGNIVIYNFDMLSQVIVDISTLGLSTGQRFEVRDGQNLFGPPIVSGTFNGSALTIPLTGSAVALPKTLPSGSSSGITQIVHTTREFNFLTVIPLDSGSPQGPTSPTNLRITG